MAGPLDLRGRVTIVNGASGVLGAIRRDLSSIGAMSGKAAGGSAVLNNALVTGAANARKFQGSVVASTAGTIGLISAMNKAEEFNKNIFGVGTAALSESTKRIGGQVVYDFNRVQEVMKEVEATSLSMSRELGQAPSRISGISEVLAKAGFNSEKLAEGTRSIAIAAATDTETPVGRIAEFASVLDTIYKPRGNERWGQFFARQMDIVRVAAGETRLSVGSMMEGLRPFSALYARLGHSETQSALMLMSGVRAGGEATEVGHTLKSSALRLMIPTGPQMEAFSRAEFNRADYMPDLKAQSPKRAVQGLAATFTGITGKFRSQLERDFDQAAREGKATDPAFLERIQDRVAKHIGVNLDDMLSADSFSEKFANSVFEAGQNVNVEKFFEDAIQRGLTPSQVANMLERRRIGTIEQILQGMRLHGEEYRQKLGMADGSGLGATQRVYDNSAYGGLMRFQAMWEQFQISIANSGGMQNVLGGLTRVFEVLGSLPGPVTEVAVALGVFAIALTPIAALIRGIGIAAAAIGGVGALLGLGRAGSGMMGLGALGASAAAAGAAGSTKIGRTLAAGMTAAGVAGANKAVGDAMIRGMTGGGAAASAGGGVLSRVGMLARAGLRFLPGIGLVAMGAGAGMSAWDAYQRGDGVGGIAKSAALGSVGLDSSAEAAEAPSTAGMSANSQAAVAEAQQAAADIRAALNIDLSAEGRRAMETFAQGIAAGGAAAVSAASSVAARVRSAAQAPVQLNTGPNMQPAR